MTIYDVKNIDRCEVRPLGDSGFRVIAHEDWAIRIDDGSDENENLWTGEVGLPVGADFSKITVSKREREGGFDA